MFVQMWKGEGVVGKEKKERRELSLLSIARGEKEPERRRMRVLACIQMRCSVHYITCTYTHTCRYAINTPSVLTKVIIISQFSHGRRNCSTRLRSMSLVDRSYPTWGFAVVSERLGCLPGACECCSNDVCLPEARGRCVGGLDCRSQCHMPVKLCIFADTSKFPKEVCKAWMMDRRLE